MPPADFEIDAYLIDGAPDWEKIDFDLPCSRCGYDLRMLPHARCPECGLVFTWLQIFEARQRSNTFENHWRRRPVRSYLQTIIRGLRPRKFWAAISIHEPIRVGPLLAMLSSSPLLFMVVLYGGSGLAALVSWGIAAVLDATTGNGSAFLDVANQLAWRALYPVRRGRGGAEILMAVTVGGFGAVGLVSLLQQTLGRCRVRVAQVLRVGAYAFGPALVVLATMMFAVGILDVTRIPWEPSWLRGHVGLAVVMAACTAPLCVYYSIGLRNYLGLPRAWPIGLAAAIVAQLLAMIMMEVVVPMLVWP